MTQPAPLVGVILGSQSDWETMRHAAETLTALGVAHETKVVSAHRTPDLLFEYADAAERRGLRVIIAGAGGAAHLPGMCASKTIVPVLGVPVESKALSGMDSLLSIVQMPGGIPVGTLAIGKAGAINAALLAAAIIGATDAAVRERVRQFRRRQTETVLMNPDPRTASTPIEPGPAHSAGHVQMSGGTAAGPKFAGETPLAPPQADKGRS
jgi:5-(carboxyamino)imidazole ribonucleotide mutase